MRSNWKKIAVSILWIIAGVGTIVLLCAAVQSKNRKACADIKVEISGAERHMFIDEKDVLTLLRYIGKGKGDAISTLDLRSMEQSVERNPWVKNAEMFVDNNQVLQVRIEERQPVARVFTMDGGSFYLDSGALRLPLSDKLSARVPIFTGFPSTKKILARPDSALLENIVRMGRYIMADSFWMAQVAEIDITPQSNFEMIPVVGDHTVVLGDAEDIDKKFKRLFTFYRQAWMQNGINTYETLDVQYNNQVVAVKKGIGKARVDSARAREAMASLLAQRPLVTDSNSAVITPVTAPAVKPAVANAAPVVSKPEAAKPAVTKPKTTGNGAKHGAVVSAPAKVVHKTKSVNAANNKARKTPLTMEKKKNTNKTVQQKKVAETKQQPKAILKKHETQ